MPRKSKKTKTEVKPIMPELTPITTEEWFDLMGEFCVIAGTEIITEVYSDGTGHEGYYVLEDYHGRKVVVGVGVSHNYMDHLITNPRI